MGTFKKCNTSFFGVYSLCHTDSNIPVLLEVHICITKYYIVAQFYQIFH